MLKKQIDGQQYKYYRYIISTIDEFLENDDIKPLHILMSNLQLLYYRYRNAMFEDVGDYKLLQCAHHNKDKIALQKLRDKLSIKMNLIV
jgi:hypothetical protein